MNIKEKSKLLTKLGKVFKETKKEKRQTKEDFFDDPCVVDQANVLMIVAKSDDAKEILYNFSDKNNIQKKPKLEYISNNEEIKSTYSMAYMSHILEIFKCFENEKISFQIKKHLVNGLN